MDMQIEDLSQGVGVGIAPSVNQVKQNQEKELVMNQKIFDADVLDKTKAFGSAFANENFMTGHIPNFLNKQSILHSAADENFIMDDDIALDVLSSHKLPMNYFGDIRKVKSQSQLDAMIEFSKDEVNTNQIIKNTLHSSTIGYAGMAGTLLDIDLAVGVATGGFYSYAKGANVMANAIRFNGITEASLATLKYSVSDDYSIADGFSDFVLGTTIGSVATAASYNLGIRAKAKKFDDNPRTVEDAVKEAEETVVKPTPKRSPNEYKTEQPTTAAEAAAKKEFNDNVEVVDKAAGKAYRKADDIAHAVESEKEMSKTRTKSYATNRDSYFMPKKSTTKSALAKDRDVANKFKGKIQDLKKKLSYAKGADKAKIENKIATATKQWDTAIRRSKRNIKKRVSSNAEVQFMRTVDNMDSTVKTIKSDMAALLKQYDSDSAEVIVNEARKTNPKMVAAVEEITSKPVTKETLAKFMNDVKNQTTNKKLVAAVALLTGAGLSADEDGVSQSSFVTTALLLAAGAILTPSVIRAFLDAKGSATPVKDAWSNMSGKVSKAYNNAEVAISADAGATRRVSNMVAESLTTRMTATATPLRRESPEVAKIVDNLLYSMETGAGAEINKQQWSFATMSKYGEAETQAYKAWKTENNIPWHGGYIKEEYSMADFRNKISDAINARSPFYTGAYEVGSSKALDDMAAMYDKEMTDMFARLESYKATGEFDISTKPRDGYLPNYFNDERMSNVVAGVDEDGLIKIHTELTKAYVNHGLNYIEAQKIVDDLLEKWTDGTNMGSLATKPRSADFFKIREQKGLERSTDIEQSPKSAYTTLDPNTIEPMVVKVNGVEETVDMTVVFQRDAKVILDMTANAVHGQSAIARNGYANSDVLATAITDAVKTVPVKRKAKVKQELDFIADLVIGKPIPSNNPDLHNLAMISSDLMLTMKLPFAGLSVASEAISLLAQSAAGKQMFRTIKTMFTGKTKDSNLVQAVELSGLASFKPRLDIRTGFKGYIGQGGSLDDIETVSSVRNATIRVRDMAMYLNRLGSFTDVIQTAGLDLNMNQLAKYMKDPKSSTITAERAIQYGVDAQFINKFKDFLVIENGSLKSFDATKLTINDRDTLGQVLRVMNQSVSPEATIGSTPLFTHSSDLGRAMSSLTSFSLMQFNEQGLGSMRYFDMVGLAQTFGAITGSLFAIKARDIILDRETDEETMLLYAILASPQLGGLAAMKSLLDPATLSNSRDIHNFLMPEQLEMR
ncbi:MAG: hypothetical protein DRP58_06450 [Spirochaetes bacterium]|nr:MAG: hypothetical protein DRP58_06450 [Spirochaetota bacterium]